jgi:hypothetical protein
MCQECMTYHSNTILMFLFNLYNLRLTTVAIRKYFDECVLRVLLLNEFVHLGFCLEHL